MEVIHTTRHDTGLPGFVPTLDELLERSDIVSLHVPLSESTRHLIGAAELARMKPTAVLINTARGPVVDENALVDALEAGSIYAAGLDVFDGEPKVNPRLLSAPRTTLLPHIGSATIATRTRMARLACQGVCDVLAGPDAAQCRRPRTATRLATTVPSEPENRRRISRGIEGYDPTVIWWALHVGGRWRCARSGDSPSLRCSTVTDRRPHGRPRRASSDRCRAAAAATPTWQTTAELQRRWPTSAPSPAPRAPRRAPRPAWRWATTVATSPPSS